jgi:SNF2 family DNA or RNA helicase
LDKHNDEKVVMFTCFRTSVNVINYFINDRKVLMLTPNMSIAKRGKIIEEFQNEEDKNTILFLTYELGAEGLNLQCSHTVLIIDFWWNSGKTSQAIARVLRFGQMSDTVNVYFFTGNTGIEKALFTKQQDKLTILGELENGPLKSIVKKMTIDSVLKIIELGDNVDSLTNIN